MRNYLIEKGLDSQRVLAECKSTSTEENFLFAKEILVQQGISAHGAVLDIGRITDKKSDQKFCQELLFPSPTDMDIRN